VVDRHEARSNRGVAKNILMLECSSRVVVSSMSMSMSGMWVEAEAHLSLCCFF